MFNKINPKILSKPTGNYSQGIIVKIKNNKLLFITGQVALDKKGKIIGLNNIEKQTETVFKYIGLILKEAGGYYKNIVKVTNFITDIRLYPQFSKIRNKYLKDSKPASSLIEVSRLFKAGLLIEVEVIAIL